MRSRNRLKYALVISVCSLMASAANAELGTIDSLKEQGIISNGESAYTLTPTENSGKGIITISKYDWETKTVDFTNYQFNLKNQNANSDYAPITVQYNGESTTLPTNLETNYRTNVSNIFENIETEEPLSATGSINGGSVLKHTTNTPISIESALYKDNSYSFQYGSSHNNRHRYGGAICNTTNINSINADFINNNIKGLPYDSTGTSYVYGGAISNYTNNTSNAIIDSIKGNFIGNYSEGYYASGGAISNITTTINSIDKTATISEIIGNFIGNHADSTGKIGNSVGDDGIGGAIYNAYQGATIENITSDFIGNYVTAGYGGAIGNRNGVINNITGDFIGNYAYGDTQNVNYAVKGGAIYNDGNGNTNSGYIGSIVGNFIGNYAHSTSSNGVGATGGAIHNDILGTIDTITGSFINNFVVSDGIYASSGGAIYNSSASINKIINSDFYNNYALGDRRGDLPTGGAITSNIADLTIIADNGSSVFSGNYVQRGNDSSDPNYYKDYQAIHITTDYYGNHSVNLQAINNGRILFDDKISGQSTGLGSVSLNINGDDTSSVTLNNEVQNLSTTLNNTNLYIGEDTFKAVTFNAESGNVQLIDDKVADYNIDKLTSSNNVNYSVEIDTTGASPSNDRLIIGENSSGKVTLDDIRINGELKDFTAQIIVGQNNNTQLEISENLSNRYNTTSTETILSSDEMVKDVNWKDVFNTYEQDKTTTSTLNLATTSTKNDSIEYTNSVTLGEKVVSAQQNTLALINQFETTEGRNFNFDTSNDVYNVTSDLGTTSTGTLNINGIANESERSTINGNNHSLFKLDNVTNLNFNNIKITNATSVVESSNHNSTITLNNSELVNNNSGIKTAGNVLVKGNSYIHNNGNGIEVTSNDSVIELDAMDSKILIDDKLSGVRDSKLIIKNGTVDLSKLVSSLNINLDNTNVNLANDNILNNNNSLIVNSPAHINMANNSIGSMQLREISLNDNLSLGVDADLANEVMDKISANSVKTNGHNVNISNINLLSDATKDVVTLNFTDNSTLAGAVTTNVSEVAYSDIYKYKVGYDPTKGDFTFTRGGGFGTNSYNAYNPAVMVSPVAAQLGGYMGMLDTYNNAFHYMDMQMLKPSSMRISEQRANQYAITEGQGSYKTNETNSKGIWVRPFAAYDSVGLKNGPKVHNMSYGTFLGGDSEIFKLKRGFYGVISPYIAYQGNHQNFAGNSIYQNGGTLGLSTTLYRGNFFNGTTIGVGMNLADASTMYGSENFPMLMTGIANKTGYNWEFKEGKFIIQPSVMLSYTFVNTFDYTNGAGLRIKSDPLNAIQIAPSMKFIYNTKRGWQPYAHFGMMWNIMDATKVMANTTSLPELSVKPYFQYGVGVQKLFKDNFTAYGQIMFRNGGRNGVAAHIGGKYLLGRKEIKTNGTAKEIKGKIIEPELKPQHRNLDNM